MRVDIGSFIGPYEIVSWLGSGGMGVVYRARDPRIGRDVAIKLLAERYASDVSRQSRFEQEARAAGQLNHPNILTVHDVGTHNGAPYVVSEFLVGETLRTRLRRGPVPFPRAIDWARQTADGLSAAHDKAIVHRDIKPENLFITTSGRLKILDFGIAKLTLPGDEAVASGVQTETDPGTVVGTSGYMSPEQVRGDPLDQRSDIFGLGAVFHEMLTGVRAFGRATSADTMAAILKDEPSPSLPPDVPEWLAVIVSRCLEKPRDARFQSARDLAFALEHMSGSSATRIRTAVTPLRRWALAAVVGIVAVATAGAVWLTRRPGTGESSPETEIGPAIVRRFANARFTPLTNWEGTESGAAISADGQFVAFMADQAGQFDLWLHTIASRHLQNLTSGSQPLRAPVQVIRATAISPDSMEVAFTAREAMTMPISGGRARAFPGLWTAATAWSPDGTRIAYFKASSQLPGDPLYVADRSGADEREIFWVEEQGVHTHNPVWSPDGQWIYFVHGRQAANFEMDIWRVKPSGESPEQLTTLATQVFSVAPLDDHTVLYVAPAPDGSGPWLWALDIPSRLTHRLVAGLDHFQTVSASRDGRRIVATIARPPSSTLSQLRMLDRVAEDADIQRFSVPTDGARALRFGRTSMFYLSGRAAEEGLWRVRAGQPVELWRGADGAVLEPPAVSPDERRVAIVVRRGNRSELLTMSADGGDVRTPAPALAPEGSADWSPDGAWIVIGGSVAGSPGLFRIPAAGGEPVRIIEGSAINPAWSPDGTLIAYNGLRVGGRSTLLGVRPDGTHVSFPPVQVRPGGQRFLPNSQGIVFQEETLDFTLLDPATGVTRPLTKLAPTTSVMSGRRFDLTPDGTTIVFDRFTENADIVLIELPQGP